LTELLVREARAADYGALSEVFSEIDALHRGSLPHVFRAPDGPARSEEHLASVIADQNAAVLVAQSGAEIVGLVEVFLREAPEISIMVPRRFAVVDTLIVKEDFRRLGIGRALMQRAHQWAQARGASQVELTVWEFNSGAKAFYESLGYSTTRRTMYRELGQISSPQRSRTWARG
jgi:ribosomal protein S18 acetylase RimI-like enzyme